MSHFLGLDVGGTKTYCLIADASGRVAGFGKAGCGSYEYHGIEPAREENRRAIDAALADAGLSMADITQAGLGVAGADLPEDFVMLEREIYSPLFGDLPRVFKNDSFAALRGGVRSGVGVVVACGTGCTCAGKGPDGTETRVGGLGPEFGDACTGASIGEEGLRVVWRARDGIIPPTSMADRFVERSGLGSLEALFTCLYRGEPPPRTLEPMAEVVFDAAVDGDSAACDILRKGGDYLAAMAIAVARKLDLVDEAFDVVMAGSVFKGSSPVLREAMAARILEACPKARLVRPEYEPVVGALLLAMDARNAVTGATYAILSESLDDVETNLGIILKVG